MKKLLYILCLLAFIACDEGRDSIEANPVEELLGTDTLAIEKDYGNDSTHEYPPVIREMYLINNKGKRIGYCSDWGFEDKLAKGHYTLKVISVTGKQYITPIELSKDTVVRFEMAQIPVSYKKNARLDFLTDGELKDTLHFIYTISGCFVYEKHFFTVYKVNNVYAVEYFHNHYSCPEQTTYYTDKSILTTLSNIQQYCLLRESMPEKNGFIVNSKDGTIIYVLSTSTTREDVYFMQNNIMVSHSWDDPPGKREEMYYVKEFLGLDEYCSPHPFGALLMRYSKATQ